MSAAVQSFADVAQPAVHRDYLFRFAMRRVANRELADDLVQETMLAALQAQHKAADTGKAGYNGGSTYRVWLAGILKHKLLDALRERGRCVPFAHFATTGDDGEEIEIDPSLLQSGLEDQPANDPRQACELAELLADVNDGLQKLPKGVADVFVAREIEGETTASIATRVGLTEANIWVRVHRARKALQSHLAACGAIERMGDQRIRWAA